MDQTNVGGRKARWAAVAGLVAAGALAGGVLAGTLGASAATSTPAPSTGYTAAPDGSRPMGHGGASPVRPDEQAVSAVTAAKLRAAALKAVPGGTVYRVETDAGDGAYEAHMTKSDGSLVTVKFDNNLAVTAVEDGMGRGDPAASGQAAQGSRA